MSIKKQKKQSCIIPSKNMTLLFSTPQRSKLRTWNRNARFRVTSVTFCPKSWRNFAWVCTPIVSSVQKPPQSVTSSTSCRVALGKVGMSLLKICLLWILLSFKKKLKCHCSCNCNNRRCYNYIIYPCRLH